MYFNQGGTLTKFLLRGESWAHRLFPQIGWVESNVLKLENREGTGTAWACDLLGAVSRSRVCCCARITKGNLWRRGFVGQGDMMAYNGLEV